MDVPVLKLILENKTTTTKFSTILNTKSQQTHKKLLRNDCSTYLMTFKVVLDQEKMHLP